MAPQSAKTATWNGRTLESDWLASLGSRINRTHVLAGDGVTYERFSKSVGDAQHPIWVIENGTSVAIKSTSRAVNDGPRFAPPEGTWFTALAAAAMKQATRLPWSKPQSNAETVRRYIESFKNDQNFAVFPRLFAPGFRHHFSYERSPDDFRTWVSTGQDFLRGFPDVKVSIVRLIENGELVVEHNIARGTHQGRFRGFAPSGRQVTWEEIHLYRVVGGRIVENWPMVDFDGIAAQLTV
jgi:predicted ester cyclase